MHGRHEPLSLYRRKAVGAAPTGRGVVPSHFGAYRRKSIPFCGSNVAEKDREWRCSIKGVRLNAAPRGGYPFDLPAVRALAQRGRGFHHPARGPAVTASGRRAATGLRLPSTAASPTSTTSRYPAGPGRVRTPAIPAYRAGTAHGKYAPYPSVVTICPRNVASTIPPTGARYPRATLASSANGATRAIVMIAVSSSRTRPDPTVPAAAPGSRSPVTTPTPSAPVQAASIRHQAVATMNLAATIAARGTGSASMSLTVRSANSRPKTQMNSSPKTNSPPIPVASVRNPSAVGVSATPTVSCAFAPNRPHVRAAAGSLRMTMNRPSTRGTRLNARAVIQGVRERRSLSASTRTAAVKSPIVASGTGADRAAPSVTASRSGTGRRCAARVEAGGAQRDPRPGRVARGDHEPGAFPPGQLGGVQLLDQPSIVDDPDPGRQPGHLGQDVAGPEDRDVAVPGQPAQQVPDLDHPRRVQPVRGLVEDQQVGSMDEGLGQAQPLGVAEREGTGAAVRVRAESQPLDHLGDRGRPSEPAQPVHDLQVLPHGQLGVRCRRLDQVPDPAPDRQPARADPGTEQLDASGARANHAEQHPDHGGLASAVQPEQPVDLARGYPQRHVPDRGHVAVPLGQPAGDDHLTGDLGWRLDADLAR